MASWLEAMNAPDLGCVVAGKHFAAIQTMDEETRQEVRFMGAFGIDGPAVKSVRRSDEGTVSMSAIILKDGQTSNLNNEDYILSLRSFDIACLRGNTHRVYPGCEWTSVRVSSSLEQVTLTADFSVPGYSPPTVG